MPPTLWIAELIISDATKRKLAGKHHLHWRDVHDALVGVRGLPYVRDDDPRKGERVLVQIILAGRRCVAVLYPIDDPSGDVYALATAYLRDGGA